MHHDLQNMQQYIQQVDVQSHNCLRIWLCNATICAGPWCSLPQALEKLWKPVLKVSAVIFVGRQFSAKPFSSGILHTALQTARVDCHPIYRTYDQFIKCQMWRIITCLVDRSCFSGLCAEVLKECDQAPRMTPNMYRTSDFKNGLVPSGNWETIDSILLGNEGSKKKGKLILFDLLVCLTRCGVALIKHPVLCSRASPKLTTKEPGMGGASIHEPSVSFTCKPPLLSCNSRVK